MRQIVLPSDFSDQESVTWNVPKTLYLWGTPSLGFVRQRWSGEVRRRTSSALAIARRKLTSGRTRRCPLEGCGQRPASNETREELPNAARSLRITMQLVHFQRLAIYVYVYSALRGSQQLHSPLRDLLDMSSSTVSVLLKTVFG